MSAVATRSPGKGTKPTPEKKIGPFANGVGTCIWLNTIETEQGPRQVRSITVNARRYFDRESNQWKDAGGYNPSDLPALIFALTKAQEYCYETPLPDAPASSNGDASSDDKDEQNEVF